MPCEPLDRACSRPLLLLVGNVILCYRKSYCQMVCGWTPPVLLRARQRRQCLPARTALQKTRCERKHMGECSFSVQGPRVWNSLPVELRAPDIAMNTFRNRLKTFLFNDFANFSASAAFFAILRYISVSNGYRNKRHCLLKRFKTYFNTCKCDYV